MALINGPECNKEISDLVISGPNFGFSKSIKKSSENECNTGQKQLTGSMCN